MEKVKWIVVGQHRDKIKYYKQDGYQYDTNWWNAKQFTTLNGAKERARLQQNIGWTNVKVIECVLTMGNEVPTDDNN